MKLCKKGHEFITLNTYIHPDGKNECKSCRKERSREFYRRKIKNRPWYSAYKRAYDRTHTKTQRYFKRGLVFDMVEDDFKFLWFRDKAYLMKQPSIDRIKGKIGYKKDNCRFIELENNKARKRG